MSTIRDFKVGRPRCQIFTESGTWIRPPGVGFVDVLVVGAGGGGGGSLDAGSGHSMATGGTGGYSQFGVDGPWASGGYGGNSTYYDGTRVVNGNGGGGGGLYAGTWSATDQSIRNGKSNGFCFGGGSGGGLTTGGGAILPGGCQSFTTGDSSNWPDVPSFDRGNGCGGGSYKIGGHIGNTSYPKHGTDAPSNGGGGGGAGLADQSVCGGGGGGGEIVYRPRHPVTGDVAVTIGAGGAGVWGSSVGNTGAKGGNGANGLVIVSWFE